MQKLGPFLLTAGVVSVVLFSWIGPSFLAPAWLLTLLGLVILDRSKESVPLSRAALVVFVVIVLASLLAVGVTIGRRGTVIASTPRYDPSSLFMTLGIVAPWFAAAVLVIGHERRHGEKLGQIGLLVTSIGFVAFVGDELARAGVLPRPLLALGSSGLLALLVVGGFTLVLAYARWIRRIAAPAQSAAASSG